MSLLDLFRKKNTADAELEAKIAELQRMLIEREDFSAFDEAPADFQAVIFEGKDGYKYEIMRNGVTVLVQDCIPGAEGFQSMDEVTARQYAEQHIAGMKEAELNAYNE